MPLHGRQNSGAGDTDRQRLFVYTAGFLTQRRIRRILDLSGFDLRLGRPGAGDAVGVWGQSAYAVRGQAVAARYDAPLVRIEDALLRSPLPGRAGEPPLGLLIDRSGVHFDARQPSDLETLLRTHPLDDSAALDMARDCCDRIKAGHLSKYSGFDPALAAPPPGYVLVIDQTRGDASLTACGADRGRFLEMLVIAQEENPGAPIVIKTHPETQGGYRAGHYTAADATGRITLCDAQISPWALLEGAVAVYTVSSGMGFEAILAGHKPRVFGTPFYAGWGLTRDEAHFTRRPRTLTRAQLALGALALYPRWYDPFEDRLCDLPRALDIFEAQTRAWRDDHKGWAAQGMRLWKRGPLQQAFGHYRPISFTKDADAKARTTGRRAMVWAGKAPDASTAIRVEDGFLRSRGLGADLVPPLSLVLDDLGIYYDPRRPSRLERLIAASPALPAHALRRAEALRRQLVSKGLSKYNLGTAAPALPAGHRILVPGQVADDASMRTGAAGLTNRDLLERARAANPDAVILYKPHPDVQAGLREGHVPDAERWADVVLDDADMGQLLPVVNEVWTLTSLTGFEALLRGLPVTVLGMPFYAGWGLTTDLAPAPARRVSGITLDGLIHATLIAYPRYFDPVTRLPCPPEVVVDRLANGRIPRRGLGLRLLAKAQGVLASYAWLWRR